MTGVRIDGRPRCGWSLLGGAAAGAVAVETARRARTRRVGSREEQVFRWFNRAPDRLEAPAWVLMQAGSLGAVAVVATELARRHRTRAAAVAAVAGATVWFGVKAVKPAVGRGRPSEYLDRVAVRGRPQAGLGYPSGHAAVALTLALAACRGCRARHGAAATALAATVGATRMYVGAHLPLDVAGGLALGALAGRGAAAVLEGAVTR